ncbi:hypothetical protein ACRQ5Q_08070 [Bradyrhizobium sp. PMVTL-01]|uniref:hypothetical protein n=1 Tax=Bradyrhizobium sp. PMVTL-01 TaxID=3434999 RepID=UPI003F71B5EE
MDFDAVAPANTSPEPDTARAATDATEFERQLRGTETPALAQGVAHPVRQGEAYSPYLDAGHPYSPYFETGHLYPPYPDLAHPHSAGSGWQDSLYAAPAAVAAPEPDNGSRHLSPQIIAQAIEEHPGFDQDLIWQALDAGPSEAEPHQSEPQAGTSHAGPSRTAPFQGEPAHAGLSHAQPLQAAPSRAGSSAAPPELSAFRMWDGHLAKDYWVFTPQTATGAQIDMLERSGVKPSQDRPTTIFTILGVPHTAEWREEDFIRLAPSLDPTLWPEEGEQEQPDEAEDPPIG